MATRAEAALTRRILRELRKIPNTFWDRIEQSSIRGTADIIGCICGQFHWIEVKVELEGHLDKREHLQMYKMDQVIDAGGAGIIMYKSNWKHHVWRLKRKARKFSLGGSMNS